MDRIDFALIITVKGYNTNGVILAMESRRLKGLDQGKYTIVRLSALKTDRVSKIFHTEVS